VTLYPLQKNFSYFNILNFLQSSRGEKAPRERGEGKRKSFQRERGAVQEEEEEEEEEKGVGLRGFVVSPSRNVSNFEEEVAFPSFDSYFSS